MPEAEPAPVLFARIDEMREHLQELLAGRDEEALATRPPTGKWSVTENLRHLLFAEELHLGRFVTPRLPMSAIGMPTHNMNGKSIRHVGSEIPASTRQVFDAWAAVHASLDFLAGEDTDPVRKALDGNFRHLRAHTKVIERLLRDG